MSISFGQLSDRKTSTFPFKDHLIIEVTDDLPKIELYLQTPTKDISRTSLIGFAG